MKILINILLILTLTGCGVFDRTNASITGFARICADGVMYYQFTSGTSVAYEPNGQIRTCK